MRRADVTINGGEQTVEVFFGEAVKGMRRGRAARCGPTSRWTSTAASATRGPSASPSGTEVAIHRLEIEIKEAWDFVPPPDGSEDTTAGSTASCGGRDIVANPNPMATNSGGGKDRVGQLIRSGAWHFGFVEIELRKDGARIPDFTDAATYEDNGSEEEVESPIQAAKVPSRTSTRTSIPPTSPTWASRRARSSTRRIHARCNNLKRSYSFFGSRVLGGFEKDFRLILSPDLLTTEMYAQRVGQENMPGLLWILANEVGSAGFVPE